MAGVLANFDVAVNNVVIMDVLDSKTTLQHPVHDEALRKTLVQLGLRLF